MRAGEPDGSGRMEELFELLDELHRQKDAAYGDAWRKRGEVIAIFANIARKYDRLLVAFTEERPAGSERLGDTIADLCVYSGKYVTWLAESQPEAFQDAWPGLAAAEASALRGPDALKAVLSSIATAAPSSQEPVSVADAWSQTQAAFTALESGLMAQASPQAPTESLLSWETKITLARTLATVSAWLLVRIDDRDHVSVAALQAEVHGMRRNSG
jgi:hypothetical protein